MSIEEFQKFTPSSVTITIYYQLQKHFNDYQEERETTLEEYAEEFSTMIHKEYFSGYETFDKSNQLYEIKKRISQKTGFPIETMTKFGIYGGQFYGKDGRLRTIVNNYNCSQYITIGNSLYNSQKITDRYVYIFIDVNQKEFFVKLNENQKINDKKLENLTNTVDSLKKKNNEMTYNYFLLHDNFQSNKTQLEKLKTENNKLQKKQEENDKKEKERYQKRIEAEKAIKEDIQKVDQTKIIELEKKINQFVIKTFIQELDKQEKLKNWITKYMENFTNEFMSYCQNFNNSFKEHSQKIIQEYNSNKNIIIEHINYIVIGKTGVGKSTFINSSLLLDKDEKAKEGYGQSITQKSTLYNSKKLTMVRMWDTQGLDDKVSKNQILNEVKRLVDIGSEKGPDHYINIILYCTTGYRFQEEDGKLIHQIMQLYPADNLPVIITQLQIYDDDDAQTMEKIIRNILLEYLDKQTVDKIIIKNVISKDKKINDTLIRAKGIPDLFKISFDLMGRAITSATFKKFSQDIENLCKNYVDERIKFLQQGLKYEMEIYQEAIHTKTSDDNFEVFINERNNGNILKERTLPRNLSFDNIYKNVKDKNYFTNNFYQIILTKFKSIYNNLNNVFLNYHEDKPTIILFIENKLNNIQNTLITFSKTVFDKFFKTEFNEYFFDLQKKQNQRNRQFETYRQIIDENQKEKELRDKIYPYFNNELLKNFLCLILKLFKENVERILIENYKKELKENKRMTEIINKKAEDSLKLVTKKLKDKLLIELNKYFPSENIPNNNRIKQQNPYENVNQNNNNNNGNNIQYDDFNFPQY